MKSYMHVHVLYLLKLCFSIYIYIFFNFEFEFEFQVFIDFALSNDGLHILVCKIVLVSPSLSCTVLL